MSDPRQPLGMTSRARVFALLLTCAPVLLSTSAPAQQIAPLTPAGEPAVSDGPSGAGPVAISDAMGLPDAARVIAALDTHPGVLAAHARTDAARAQARALARGSHEITVNGIYSRRTVDFDGTYDEFDGQVTRAFRLPGKTRLDKEIGKYGVLAASNSAEDVRHQTALLLAETWWDWLAAGAQARIDRKAVATYERLLAAVQRRVELRDAARLEADQAEAMLEATRFAAQRSAGQEALAREVLLAQFPGLLSPDARPPAVPVPDYAPETVARMGQLVVERSHEIAAADATALQADASASRADADRIADPTLGLRLFSERSGQETGAGVTFSMPLGGGHRKALAEQAQAQASAAMAQVTATRFEVDARARSDMTGARYAFTAWQRARRGLEAQVSALEKLRLGYRAGEIDLGDELVGERQVLEALHAEAEARSEALRALTRLRIDSHSIWAAEGDED